MKTHWLLLIALAALPACREAQTLPTETEAEGELANPATAAGTATSLIPTYSASTILPNGGREPAPLAPGMLVSIYGEHLGPENACPGSADPQQRETPHPRRPNQTLVETQVFPKRLCDTEVHVGGIAAGLLYVQARHINFKVPQQLPVGSTSEVRVSYRGRPGPTVTVDLGNDPNTEAAPQLAEKMWSGLRRVDWEAPYPAPTGGGDVHCMAVPRHKDLRGGLYGHVYHCSHPMRDVVGESFYYPADGAPPAVLLRRADFRLGVDYPAMSAEVEQLLGERLTRAYGPGTVPDHLFEIGASRPNPGLSWRAGEITIFLHRNRNYVAPTGIREGVQLIAVRREVLEERELIHQLEDAFLSSVSLAHPMIAEDLKGELGSQYVMPTPRPESEPERLKREREASDGLLGLLRQSGEGSRNHRAAVLVAADDLAVRLGQLLVRRSMGNGGEQLTEAPGADRIRRQLAPYDVEYAEIGHYSGDLEYDRRLLHRAWKAYPDTAWGQRAFLMLQRLSCALAEFGCEGPNCFREVIRQGEDFLRSFPETPFRREQIYHLALAYETWWSLSQAEAGDITTEGAQVDIESAGRARRRAIDLYEELLRIVPDSPEAQTGRLRLPTLKLGLDTGERTFFCISC